MDAVSSDVAAVYRKLHEFTNSTAGIGAEQIHGQASNSFNTFQPAQQQTFNPFNMFPPPPQFGSYYGQPIIYQNIINVYNSESGNINTGGNSHDFFKMFFG